jgi:hypothetical protein
MLPGLTNSAPPTRRAHWVWVCPPASRSTSSALSYGASVAPFQHVPGPERPQPVERRRGLGAALGDVAERNDDVGLEPLQIGNRGLEGDVVPVDVRDEPDSHERER